jgi:hypothetical protein
VDTLGLATERQLTRHPQLQPMSPCKPLSRLLAFPTPRQLPAELPLTMQPMSPCKPSRMKQLLLLPSKTGGGLDFLGSWTALSMDIIGPAHQGGLPSVRRLEKCTDHSPKNFVTITDSIWLSFASSINEYQYQKNINIGRKVDLHYPWHFSIKIEKINV